MKEGLGKGRDFLSIGLSCLRDKGSGMEGSSK